MATGIHEGPSDDDRRVHERHAVAVSMRIRDDDRVIECEGENLSFGGACLVHRDHDARFEVGRVVEVEVALPGQARRAKLQAEVRWTTRGRSGLMFRGGAMAAVAAFIGTLMSAQPVGAATTTVPEFDPNADVVLDMNAGGERPDEYSVLQAFEQQYDAFDACVDKAKKRASQKLPGDVDVAVLLSPKGKRPLGVNAELDSKLRAAEPLRQCLRTAVAAAPYPAYDGPPVVVQFSFELDPGSEYVAP